MLHAALTSLERELKERYDVPLVVRQGKAADILPRVAQGCAASACHVIIDDVEPAARAAQQAGVAALEAYHSSVREYLMRLQRGAEAEAMERLAELEQVR